MNLLCSLLVLLLHPCKLIPIVVAVVVMANTNGLVCSDHGHTGELPNWITSQFFFSLQTCSVSTDYFLDQLFFLFLSYLSIKFDVGIYISNLERNGPYCWPLIL